MIKTGMIGLAIKVFAALIAFVSNIIVANFLGADQSGYYYYIISLLGVFCTASVFGGNTFILKCGGDSALNTDSSFFYKIVISISFRTLSISLVIIAIFYILRSQSDLSSAFPLFFNNPSFTYLTLCIPILAVNVILNHALQAQGKLTPTFLTAGFSHSLTFLILVCVARPATAESVSTLYLISALFVFLYILYFLNPIKEKNFSFDVRAFKLHFQTVRFFVIQIGLELLKQLPIVLLGILQSSPAEISGFAISWRIAATLSFVYDVANRILMPRFATYHASGRIAQAQKEFYAAIFVLAAASTPAVLVIILYASYILGLFGEEFVKFSEVLCILAVYSFINNITGPAGNLLLMTDQQHIFRNLVYCGVLIGAASSFYLLPLYGAKGASLSFFLSYGFVNISSFLYAVSYLRRESKMEVLRQF